MSKDKIAIIVGSLRENSSSKKIAKILGEKFSDHLEPKYLEIGDLPLYNPDLETDTPPKAWLRFRSELSECNAVLFITPEYNRTIPAAIKNALDVGSQPYGKSLWDDMPGAVMSIAAGSLGGFGANHHLRQAVVFLNVNLMQQPEAYVPFVNRLFNEEGELISEDTDKFFDSFVMKFENWIDRIK